MTDIEAIHPPPDRLAAYAQGRLDEPEMDEIERHLSTCDTCCRAIEDQPGDSLVWKLRARAASMAAATAAAGMSVGEPTAGFQVPSSFVVGLTDNPPSTINRPSPARPPIRQRWLGSPRSSTTTRATGSSPPSVSAAWGLSTGRSIG